MHSVRSPMPEVVQKRYHVRPPPVRPRHRRTRHDQPLQELDFIQRSLRVARRRLDDLECNMTVHSGGVEHREKKQVRGWAIHTQCLVQAIPWRNGPSLVSAQRHTGRRKSGPRSARGGIRPWHTPASPPRPRSSWRESKPWSRSLAWWWSH